MLLVCKVNDKDPNYWEALIHVVSISTCESIVIWIDLQVNDDLITILKIHFPCSDFVRNEVGAE